MLFSALASQKGLGGAATAPGSIWEPWDAATALDSGSPLSSSGQCGCHSALERWEIQLLAADRAARAFL